MACDEHLDLRTWSTKFLPQRSPFCVTRCVCRQHLKFSLPILALLTNQFIRLYRNGLRPSRYYITKDRVLVMASEVGVYDTEPANILTKVTTRTIANHFKSRVWCGREAVAVLVPNVQLLSSLANLIIEKMAICSLYRGLMQRRSYHLQLGFESQPSIPVEIVDLQFQQPHLYFFSLCSYLLSFTASSGFLSSFHDRWNDRLSPLRRRKINICTSNVVIFTL